MTLTDPIVKPIIVIGRLAHGRVPLHELCTKGMAHDDHSLHDINLTSAICLPLNERNSTYVEIGIILSVHIIRNKLIQNIIRANLTRIFRSSAKMSTSPSGLSESEIVRFRSAGCTVDVTEEARREDRHLFDVYAQVLLRRLNERVMHCVEV